MATAVYVLYGTTHVDLSWIPDDVEVVLVANDTRFDWAGCDRPGIVRVDTGSNVGFGAAVNAALPHLAGERLVLVNPDTELRPHHWDALVRAESHEIVTVPLSDADGVPTVVVRAHYTPLTLALTSWRAGRLLPRRHRAPTATATGGRAATDVWASGACLSIPLDRFRSVGGFDERYFLYFEDADLGRRIASRFPDTVVRTADVDPGTHRVGATATTPRDRIVTRRAHARSALLYAAGNRSPGWRCAAIAATARCRWTGVDTPS